jgi:hypothetical protein
MVTIDAFGIFAFVVFGVLLIAVVIIIVVLGSLPGRIAAWRGHRNLRQLRRRVG